MRRHPIMIIAIALVLALVSCTNDSGMNPGGSTLTLRATIGKDSASVSETFSAGDAVTILINDNKYTYTVSADGKLSSEIPYYFHSPASIEVQGIYPAIDSIQNNSFTWKVETDQSSDGYEKSDLLVSSGVEVSVENPNSSLVFYHQAARIVINVKESEFLEANTLSSVKINDVAITGQYTLPADEGTHGTWTTQSGSTEGDITLRKTDFPAEGYAESYEAIVIPQEIVSGKGLFVFTVEGYSPFSYVTESAKPITWEAGKEYTYNVTIKPDKVTNQQHIREHGLDGGR